MTLDAIRARLAAGDKLHMQLVDGQRVWWFEDPWEQIADGIAERLKAAGEIVELGDSLFGIAGNSQSWGGGSEMTDRTPCLNPSCRRTFRREREGETVVCGKCWKLLPQSWRARDRQLRKRLKLISRMEQKGQDYRRRGRKFGFPAHGAPQAFTMGAKFERLWERHWDRISAFYLAPEKPAGLDTFLEEIGL